jgi:hypothetical protein|mmetsp:Transcript_9985/g.22132  ORF Transcript_9985/g.22132 Transcript_9985/m.22132 type:complete len:86 (-) Transcript_9985:1453-1710(-)
MTFIQPTSSPSLPLPIPAVLTSVHSTCGGEENINLITSLAACYVFADLGMTATAYDEAGNVVIVDSCLLSNEEMCKEYEPCWCSR